MPKISTTYVSCLVLFSVVLSWCYAGNVPWIHWILTPFFIAFITTYGYQVYKTRVWKLSILPLLWLLPTFWVYLSTSHPILASIRQDETTLHYLRNVDHWFVCATARETWIRWFTVSTIFFATLPLWNQRLSRTQFYSILACIGVNTGFLWSWGMFVPSDFFFNSYAFGVFIYHNHWAIYSLMIACLALGLALRSTKGTVHPWFRTPFSAYLLCTILLFASVISIASRSGVICYMLLFSIFIYQARKLKFLTLLISGFLITCVVFVYFYHHSIISKTIAAGNPFTGRLELYQATWHQIMERPIFGWGLNSFSNLQPILIPNGAHYTAVHMDYLQLAFEFGLPIALTLTFLIFYGLYRLRPLREPISVGLWLSLVFASLYAFFDFPFQAPAILLNFAIFAGLLKTRNNMLTQDNKTNPPKLVQRK